jgi:hypothetical protein
VEDIWGKGRYEKKRGTERDEKNMGVDLYGRCLGGGKI